MDNTEGSQVISQVYSARKNLKLCLTRRQLFILLGSIIGDSYIYPLGKVCFDHSARQKDYLVWKHTELKSIAYPKISCVKRFDKRTKKQTISWRFFLKQYFRPLRQLFYINGKKVIPKDLKGWLSPLLLAVWYMDDGHLDRGKYPLFATEGFSETDVKYLSEILYTEHGLKSIVTSKKRLRIISQSKQRFFQLIEPFIHPNLKYKLP
ncbi:MAG: hypothetical protein ABIJ03_00290 [Patescibacteria group bacterium]|nr:hypothetical protein [Patescibacteria group bacterium]